MAEVTENPTGPPGELSATATPPVPATEADVKREPQSLDYNVIPGLVEAIQSGLKRQRTPEAESNGDEKRQKTEPEPEPQPQPEPEPEQVTDDWASILQNALGDAMNEQLGQDTSATAQDHEPFVVGATGPAAPAPTTRPRRVQKKLKFCENPTYIIRSMGLPLLASLAVQILLALSERSRQETVALIGDKTSDVGKAYGTLKAAFDQARKMFSDTSPILLPDELEIKELGDQEAIQMANMATISASIFEASDVSLAEIQEHFLAAFVSESGSLTDELLDLFIDLKIQVAVEELKVVPEGQPIEPTLEKCFPPDLEEQFTQSFPDSSFAGITAKLKQESFFSEAKSSETKVKLAQTYSLDIFRDTLSIYLQSNLEGVLRFAESQGIEIPAEDDSTIDEQAVNALLGSENDDLAAALQAVTSSFGGLDVPNHNAPGLESGVSDGLSSATDSLGLKKLIEESLSKDASFAAPMSQENGDSNGIGGSTGLLSLITEKFGQNASAATTAPQQITMPGVNAAMVQNAYASHYAQYPYGLPYPGYQPTQYPSQQSTGNGNTPLPPNQSSPSAILYQRARQAAAAKSSAHSRREGLHSTRRPWTAEEEQALMHGLDQVKGPHWSQILQLYGPEGTVSNILKDRSQVQLKDKARNLKLFFLKTNSEMPYYLQCVTGELKTRAPSQAARKEAEERARVTSEEDQARLHGVMALAGGLQNHSPRPPASQSSTTQRPQQPMSAASPARTSASPAVPAISAVPSVHANRSTLPNQTYPQQTAPLQPAPQQQVNAPVTQQNHVKTEPASATPLTQMPTAPGRPLTSQQPLQQASQQPFAQASPSTQQQIRQPVQQQPPRPIAQANPQPNSQPRVQAQPQAQGQQRIQPQPQARPQVQGQTQPVPQVQQQRSTQPQQVPQQQQGVPQRQPQQPIQPQQQAVQPQPQQPVQPRQQQFMQQQQPVQQQQQLQSQPHPQQSLQQQQVLPQQTAHQHHSQSPAQPQATQNNSQLANHSLDIDQTENHDASAEASLLETLKAATAAIPG